MNFKNKAITIELLKFNTPQMRVFHMSWMAFFLCFFAWFGIAPLMILVREELSLTKEQVGNIIIASVSCTIFARLLIGWCCDRYGPRLTYTGLLLLGSLPVMGIGLAENYTSFLLFRLGIGFIGGSFVITQYHTTLMFAPNVVGTANATTAGWGNLGGGVTQMMMPLVLGLFLVSGFTSAESWRLAMVVAGIVCLLMGVAYFLFTQDAPAGNFKELRARGEMPRAKQAKGAFKAAAKDYRSWILFLVYGACFGIELTMNNVAVLYFYDYFSLDLKTAGLIAGLFGLMNLFARTLGGYFGDKFGIRWGLKGRVRWLMLILSLEAVCLLIFSRMTILPVAIVSMVFFSLAVQMTEGATFSIVPFISKKSIGAVSGIVGAGGNVGAVMAGFLFKGSIAWPDAFLYMGFFVLFVVALVPLIKFSAEEEHETKVEIDNILIKKKRGELVT